jgi:hypothetical protein
MARGGASTTPLADPARLLAFTPGQQASISSLSHSTKPSSTTNKRGPPSGMHASTGKKKKSNLGKKGSTRDMYVSNNDDDENLGTCPDEVDSDADFVDVTSARQHNRGRDSIATTNSDLLKKAMIDKHHQVFMERAFPTPQSNIPDAILSICRPQEELDYIRYCVEHWEVGTVIKEMQPGPARDRLSRFCKNNPKGNKYKDQYILEQIQVPGALPTTVIRRKEKGMVGRIVVSREQVFDAIDDWHRANGHIGQERNWGYCRDKYYNCTQALVRIYCEMCYTCIKKTSHQGSKGK